MNSTGFMPRSVGFVRAWVRLYTAGLPPGLRDSRREEIDADLWEQSQEAETKLRDGPSLGDTLTAPLAAGPLRRPAVAVGTHSHERRRHEGGPNGTNKRL